jgi:hypothetical protein
MRYAILLAIPTSTIMTVSAQAQVPEEVESCRPSGWLH